jgi:hypothetical protein
MGDRGTVVRWPSTVSNSSVLLQRTDRLWNHSDLAYSTVTACSFPGDKAIRSWTWSLPSIYYHWLLRLIFVNILRSVGTVRDQNWSVVLVGSVRDFRENKIFSSGMLRDLYWQLPKFRDYLFGSSWPLKMGPTSRSETSLPIYIA